MSHTTGIIILESTVVAETIGTSKYTWWIVTGNVCVTTPKFYRNRGNSTVNMAYNYNKNREIANNREYLFIIFILP